MLEKRENLALKIKVLPKKPGVYQYFDKDGKILYVGKAKNLKNRVSSYFNKNQENGKTRILVKQIQDLKYIVVDNELDALLLENNLIKKYRPKYNIQLKDDKTYPWICIKKEPFPRVFTTRRLIKDGSKYFGPYPSVKVVNTLLSFIREVYPLRNCQLDLSAEKIKQKKHKVCLEYHLGNCKGPCEAHESSDSYQKYIDDIEHIIKGNLFQVIKTLKGEMQKAAEELNFESAQEIKEKIETISKYQAKSTVVSPTITQVDVITVLDDEKCAYVNYLVINNGAIVHGYTVQVNKKLDESIASILGYVLPEMREKFGSQSKEVLVAQEVDLVFEGINLFIPQRGDKKALIDLSIRNTKFFKLDKQKQEALRKPERHTERILDQLQNGFSFANSSNSY